MDTVQSVIAKDLPKFYLLMKDIKLNCDKVSTMVDKIIAEVTDSISDTSKGLSFLDVKLNLLLSYLINLTYFMIRKGQGEKIEGDAAIDRIVEIRTVLEKMRPIEQKLRYQIDKLVKTAATGAVNENDPLSYAANPDNLVPKLNEDESDEEKISAKVNKLYVVPKMAAVHYEGDVTDAVRQQQKSENVRKRILSSGIMAELREEYHDGPEEITETFSVKKMKKQPKKKWKRKKGYKRK